MLDERLAEKYSAVPNYVSTAPGVAYAHVPDYARSRKDVFHKAPTLAALAQDIGADPANLAQAVADQNASIAAQSGRLPIGHGPFCAWDP